MTEEEKLKHDADRIVMLKARSIIIRLSEHVEHLEWMRKRNTGPAPSTLTNNIITEALSTLDDIAKALQNETIHNTAVSQPRRTPVVGGRALGIR